MNQGWILFVVVVFLGCGDFFFSSIFSFFCSYFAVTSLIIETHCHNSGFTKETKQTKHQSTHQHPQSRKTGESKIEK